MNADQEYVEANNQRLAELEAAIQEAEAALDVDARLKAAGVDPAQAREAISRMSQQATPEARKAAEQQLAEQQAQDKAARAQAISAMSKTATAGGTAPRRPRNMA